MRRSPLRWRAALAVVSVALAGARADEEAGDRAVTEDPARAARVDGAGLRLVRIEAGEFVMGLEHPSTVTHHHRNSGFDDGTQTENERPAYPVRISRPFWIGAHEVTVGQFRAFVEATGHVTDAERDEGGAWVLDAEAESEVDRFRRRPGTSWRSPGFEQTDAHPVTCVSHRDATAFCAWRSAEEGARYRLPSEAEWEYACRAGSAASYTCGHSPDDVYAFGNVADAALHAVHPDLVLRQRIVGLEPGEGDGHVYTAPVGSFRANAWGLHDVHGNVWEWCDDLYSDRVYEGLLAAARKAGSYQRPVLTVDPRGPETTPQHEYGDWRSIRGGSWYVGPVGSRASTRAFAEASDGLSYLGFRVVRDVEPEPAAPSDAESESASTAPSDAESESES